MQYIKDDIIQEYVIQKNEKTGRFNTLTVASEDNNSTEVLLGKWMPIGPENAAIKKYYYYNQFIPNYTRHLVIKDDIYDSYTHEYLGDYLRFKRDYLGINLMSLYNCFSNRICSRLSISAKLGNNVEINFDTSNSEYKIYMLPAKLNKDYTIAIESDIPVEICCAVFGKYQDTRKNYKLYQRLLMRSTLKWALLSLYYIQN